MMGNNGGTCVSVQRLCEALSYQNEKLFLPLAANMRYTLILKQGCKLLSICSNENLSRVVLFNDKHFCHGTGL